MSTWKRILTEDDGNLGTTNLTIPNNTLRSLTLESETSGYSQFSIFHNPDSEGPYPVADFVATQTAGDAVSIGTNLYGNLSIKGNSTNGPDGTTAAGSIRLFESGSQGTQNSYVALSSGGGMSSNYTIQLPTTTPGGTGKVLEVSNYAGTTATLGWIDTPSGSGDNLGSANLQSDDTARTFTTKNETGSSLEIKTQNSGGANFKLTSGSNTSNDRASIQSNGVEFRNIAGNSGAKIELYEGSNYGSNKFVFQAPSSMTADRSYLLPHVYPTSNGQVLSSTTTGVMSWVNNSGGSGGISGGGANGRLALWSGASSLTSDSGITYDPTDDEIGAGQLTVTSSGQGTGTIFSEKLLSDLIGVAISSATTGTVGRGARYLDKYGGGTILAGRVYYINGSTWALATNTSQQAGGGLLAVGTDATSPSEMLLNGTVTMATNNGWNTAPAGKALYLYTNGNLDDTPPTTGVKRIVAYVLDAANRKVYWNPDNSYIT